MRIKIISLIVLGIVPTFAHAATTFDKWWEHDTICTIDETRCYRTLTAGIDEEWDTNGACRGRKYICANALTAGGDEPRAMTRAEIAAGTGIISDFDVNVYVDNCYGARKSKNGGTMVSLNGDFVRVWCPNILSNPTEQLQYGEITNGTQPTCASLAGDNIAAILNGKCYGKQYPTTNYAIECNGEIPKLILLNGANYNPAGRGLTSSDASSAFNSMVSTSATQRGIHFNR